jgi:hypothetical protein
LADDAGRLSDAVLDDLEARLTAGEHGDLEALSGWTAPPAAGPLTSVDRGVRILARQQALLARLRGEQSRTVAALAALRKPQRRAPAPPPAYVDRSL